ncbi:MAG: virulence RhuM family protein [Paludibacter sp.]|nr:virulence RhuM family protein [Paludibacter sp.]
MNSNGEIILYQSEDSTQLEVRIEDETVWLTLNQISALFDRDKSVISRHIKNVFDEQELDYLSTVAKNATVQMEGGKEVLRQIEFYNLDVIISVGYRVKSKRGTQFRIWANSILKEYLMKGYVLHSRMDRVEKKILEHDQKFDLLIKTSLPPHEGIFFDGQIFDAWKFATDLVKSAKQSIVLIDNYVDESVLLLLSKRTKGVKTTIFSSTNSKQFHLDLEKYNAQYEPIEVILFTKSHDRFLIIDNETVYHIGASLKDLAKKWFAFSKIELNANEMIIKINNK